MPLLPHQASSIADSGPRLVFHFNSSSKTLTQIPQITFISFVVLFELGSMICALAKNSDMLIVGRAIAGMGGSGLVNGALTIIAASVPMQKRASMFSKSHLVCTANHDLL